MLSQLVELYRLLLTVRFLLNWHRTPHSKTMVIPKANSKVIQKVIPKENPKVTQMAMWVRQKVIPKVIQTGKQVKQRVSLHLGMQMGCSKDCSTGFQRDCPKDCSKVSVKERLSINKEQSRESNPNHCSELCHEQE